MVDTILTPPPAVVLCGGNGTRIQSLNAQCPKSMLLIDGQPFLCHLVESLLNSGIQQIILSTGHLSDNIFNYFDNDHWHTKGVILIKQPMPLRETGGAIRHAAEYVQTDHFLVLNGDTIFMFEPIKAFQFHLDKKRPITAVLSDYANQNARQVFTVRDRVTYSAEGDRVLNSTSDQCKSNSGVYIVNRQYILEHIQADTVVSFEKEVVPKLALEGKISAYVENCPIFDFGTPESYHEAHSEGLSKIMRRRP